MKEWIVKDALNNKYVQELIRCKNCKNHGDYECPITMLTSQVTDDDWFCADGREKE